MMLLNINLGVIYDLNFILPAGFLSLKYRDFKYCSCQDIGKGRMSQGMWLDRLSVKKSWFGPQYLVHCHS